MKLVLYSIYDRAACQYGPVWQSVNDAVAVRAARRALSSVAEWDRESYVIREVGVWDDQSGIVVGTMVRDVEYQPRPEDWHQQELIGDTNADR